MAPKASSKAASSAAPAKKGKAAKKEGPKRPLSAYMFMSQDWRERIKAANPDASFGEVGRLLGAKWQEMSEAQKKPYLDMAERDKVRAANEKAAFEKKSGSGKGSKKQQTYEEDSD